MSTKIPGKEMKYSMQSYNGSRTHNVTKNKEKLFALFRDNEKKSHYLEIN